MDNNNYRLPSLLGFRNNQETSESLGMLRAMEQANGSSLPSQSVKTTTSAFSTTGSLASFDDALMLVLLGEPEWVGKSSLGIDSPQSLCQALIEEYRDKGAKFLDTLSGEYLFVLVDEANDTLIAGVDRMTRFPLYWARTKSGIVLASTASAVLAYPGVERVLSHQGIYNFVYSHMIPSPSTVYDQVQKLSAGQRLVYTKSAVTIRNVLVPNFQARTTLGFSNAGAKLKQLLKRSVEKQLESSLKTGAFLSGGLDSSTVVGMMAELSEGEPEAFAIGFDAEGYDEMPYARITAKHFGVKLNEYYVTPDDVVEALPKVATSYDEPFGNSSALPAYFCAKFAKEQGMDRLLAGDGGDELFAGNERYAKQSIFEAYGYLPKWLRAGAIEPILAIAPERLSLFRKANSYIKQANVQLPDRLRIYNYVNLHSPSELFTDEFLADVNTQFPEEYYRDVYNIPEKASKLSRMLYLDWQYTLADNDLRKVSHMCAVAGIDVAYPMIDDELIEFSCTLPDQWKLKGQNLRYLFKEALRGWLPDATISKAKHGFGLPFGIWMSTHKPLQELAYEALSSLKKRGYFKPEFIDNVIKMHRDTHAVYYGELVWILTVLELWMTEHAREL
ncbi:MAG: asparagine synthase-related protein [Sedimenticola sp.]|nr:asparagine synthase-related protein [Sedimenticola sp.]